MESIKKAILNCYRAQGVLLLLFFLIRFVIGVGVPIFLIGLIYLINGFICNTVIIGVLRRNLKEVSPDMYKELFQNFPYLDGFKALSYAFNKEDKTVENMEDVRKIKKYLKSYNLLFVLIFVLFVVMMLLSS